GAGRLRRSGRATASHRQCRAHCRWARGIRPGRGKPTSLPRSPPLAPLGPRLVQEKGGIVPVKGQAVRLASRPPVASDEMRFRCYGIFPADRLAVKETVVLSLDISHLSLVLLAAFAVPATQASPSAACPPSLPPPHPNPL